MLGSGRKAGRMPRLRHTIEQILAKLREAEVALSKGQPVAQVCRSLAITEQTYYRWRNEYGEHAQNEAPDTQRHASR